MSDIEIHESAFIAPSAALFGRIRIGPGASVWHNAVMRAEACEIRIGRMTNVQDFVMVHVGYDEPTLIGDFCSITHHATVHGCVIEDHCLVGINAVIMDIALECKERGIGLIGVTSLPHSSQTASRHSSGKRLFEVADVVIDTGIPLADAAIKIDGLDSPVGASSTCITIAVAHAIVSATAEKLVRQGVTPHVMVSPNTAGKEAANRQNDENYEQLWRRLKAR